MGKECNWKKDGGSLVAELPLWKKEKKERKAVFKMLCLLHVT